MAQNIFVQTILREQAEPDPPVKKAQANEQKNHLF
jgi:hypothetical protein